MRLLGWDSPPARNMRSASSAWRGRTWTRSAAGRDGVSPFAALGTGAELLLLDPPLA